MARIEILAPLALFFAAVGCAQKSADSTEIVAVDAKYSPADGKAASPALGAVNASLKTGAYDDAAARLLELQASGHNFSPREAAEYRRALNEAYTRALEAADKGDARAEAAIKMIRAANMH
jgi:hypothetical protein